MSTSDSITSTPPNAPTVMDVLVGSGANFLCLDGLASPPKIARQTSAVNQDFTTRARACDPPSLLLASGATENHASPRRSMSSLASGFPGLASQDPYASPLGLNATGRGIEVALCSDVMFVTGDDTHRASLRAIAEETTKTMMNVITEEADAMTMGDRATDRVLAAHVLKQTIKSLSEITTPMQQLLEDSKTAHLVASGGQMTIEELDGELKITSKAYREMKAFKDDHPGHLLVCVVGSGRAYSEDTVALFAATIGALVKKYKGRIAFITGGNDADDADMCGGNDAEEWRVTGTGASVSLWNIIQEMKSADAAAVAADAAAVAAGLPATEERNYASSVQFCVMTPEFNPDGDLSGATKDMKVNAWIAAQADLAVITNHHGGGYPRQIIFTSTMALLGAKMICFEGGPGTKNERNNAFKKRKYDVGVTDLLCLNSGYLLSL